MIRVGRNEENSPRMHLLTDYMPDTGEFIFYLRNTETPPIIGFYTHTNGFCDLQNNPVGEEYKYWGYTGASFGVDQSF